MRAGAAGGVFVLVVVALVRRHDVDHQAVAFDLGNHVPEAEHAAQVVFSVQGFAAKQHVEVAGVKEAFSPVVMHFVAPVGAPVAGAPFTTGQFLRSSTQHAFDATARQIGQAVGVEECKAVFQRVFVAQAGGEGGCGGGL